MYVYNKSDNFFYIKYHFQYLMADAFTKEKFILMETVLKMIVIHAIVMEEKSNVP